MKPVTRQYLIAGSIFLLVVIYFSIPLFAHLNHQGTGDWDQFTFFNRVSTISLFEYGQIPYWNPYYFGGRPFLAYPQAGTFRPTIFFLHFFGVLPGLKIEALFLMVVGMLGMFTLVRHFGWHPAAGVLAGFVFTLTSFFTLHLAEGNTQMMQYQYAPWIFWTFLKARRDRRYLLPTSLLMGFAIYAGGVGHVVIPLFLFLGIFVVFHTAVHREKDMAVNLVLLCLLTAGFSALKLVPMGEYMLEKPRKIQSDEHYPFTAYYYVLLHREQTLRYPPTVHAPQVHSDPYFPEQIHGWHGYGAYVGLLPVLLCLLGVFWGWKNQKPLVLTAGVCLLLPMGKFASWAPWALLHKLPVFSSIRVPSRFSILLVFTLALLAGLALHQLYQLCGRYRKQKQTLQFLVLALVGLVGVDLAIVNRPVLYDFVTFPLPKTQRDGPFVQVFDEHKRRMGGYSAMFINMRNNLGTINGYDPIIHYTYARFEQNPRYRGEVYLENGQKATYSYWSPNRLVVDYETDEKTTLVVNQNWDSSWHLSGKGEVLNHYGLVATSVEAGRGQVVFYYRPMTAVIGFWITLFTLVAMVLWWFRSRKTSTSPGDEGEKDEEGTTSSDRNGEDEKETG